MRNRESVNTGSRCGEGQRFDIPGQKPVDAASAFLNQRVLLLRCFRAKHVSGFKPRPSSAPLSCVSTVCPPCVPSLSAGNATLCPEIANILEAAGEKQDGVPNTDLIQVSGG